MVGHCSEASPEFRTTTRWLDPHPWPPVIGGQELNFII